MRFDGGEDGWWYMCIKSMINDKDKDMEITNTQNTELYISLFVFKCQQ